jgi:hypothetical protein
MNVNTGKPVFNSIVRDPNIFPFQTGLFWGYWCPPTNAVSMDTNFMRPEYFSILGRSVLMIWVQVSPDLTQIFLVILCEMGEKTELTPFLVT